VWFDRLVGLVLFGMLGLKVGVLVSVRIFLLWVIIMMVFDSVLFFLILVCRSCLVFYCRLWLMVSCIVVLGIVGFCLMLFVGMWWLLGLCL